MSEKSKNRKKELEDFLRYSQDRMSEAERNAFERSLEQDSFDAEAMDGLASISPEEAKADLTRLRVQLQNRVTGPSRTIRNTRAMWYRVAAAVAALLVVTSVLFTLFNNRMGQLDRNVAESPEAEKEELLPTSPVENAQTEPAVEITPVQSMGVDGGVDALEKVESPRLKSEVGKTERADKALSGAVDEEIAREMIEEEAALEEMADMQPVETEKVAVTEFAAEKEAEYKAAVPAQAAEIHTDEVAAPAPATVGEKPVAARSRKRGAAEPLQVAGAKGVEQRNISGHVISGEDMQPLNGVVVAVKGSNTGTVTDLEGRFEISIEENPDNTLVAYFIGMEPKEVPIADQVEFMITLEPDAKSLDEVVIIGTAPSKNIHLTGTTVQVSDYSQEPEDLDYKSATPAGGKKEFNQYIKSNMQFPEQDDGLTRAVVVLNFMVGQDGRPEQIFVLKSPAQAFSDEATRLLMEGPDWQPAEKNGNYIALPSWIRIIFKKERP